MRTVPIALLLASAVGTFGCQGKPNAEPSPAPSFQPNASVREIMQSVVAPSAQGLWDSVGTISNAQGTVNLEPKTDADWAALRRHAIALAEATNLLMIPGRHIAPAGAQTLKADEADPGAELPPDEIEKRVNANWPTWIAMARALHGSAETLLRAVDTRSVQGLETDGGELDAVCENCHLAFWYPPQNTAAK